MHSRTENPRRAGRLFAAAAAVAAIAAGSLAFAAPANAAEAAVTDAVFDWGFNTESGGGAFAPGTCNFFSAGEAGNTGSSRVWTEADGFFKTSEGNVTIVKPTADGTGVQNQTWANKCQTPAGTAVNTGANVSGNRVQITGGTGTVDVDANTADIAWDGSFTVVYYSGYTYWTATDPHLVVNADGTGTLTATASGYGADMNDTSVWTKLTPRTITLANLTGVDVTASGVAVTPNYLGVAVNTGTGTAQVKTGTNWGSFPQDFVDFQFLTGQSSYWYSSGGSVDSRKPTTPLNISYTLTDVEPEEPGETTPGEIGVVVPEQSTEPGGAFNWAWASENPVSLGTATASGANFVASGALNNVVVTDTRTGGTGSYSWSLSGQSSSFVSGANNFSGGYLGWTPKVVSGTATPGGSVTSTQLSGAGLASAAVLASSTAATSATVGADLSLVIPGSTAAGDYKATLTVTAVN